MDTVHAAPANSRDNSNHPLVDAPPLDPLIADAADIAREPANELPQRPARAPGAAGGVRGGGVVADRLSPALFQTLIRSVASRIEPASRCEIAEGLARLANPEIGATAGEVVREYSGLAFLPMERVKGRQISAKLAGLEFLAKYHGLVTERSVVTHLNGDPAQSREMEQLRALRAELERVGIRVIEADARVVTEPKALPPGQGGEAAA